MAGVAFSDAPALPVGASQATAYLLRTSRQGWPAGTVAQCLLEVCRRAVDALTQRLGTRGLRLLAQLSGKTLHRWRLPGAGAVQHPIEGAHQYPLVAHRSDRTPGVTQQLVLALKAALWQCRPQQTQRRPRGFHLLARAVNLLVAGTRMPQGAECRVDLALQDVAYARQAKGFAIHLETLVHDATLRW